MKTIILIEEGRIQLVLKSETEHDRDVLKILDKLPNAHRCDFMQTRGGFTRGLWTGDTPHRPQIEKEDLLIVFDEPKKEPPNAEPLSGNTQSSSSPRITD